MPLVPVAERWLQTRSFHHSRYSAAQVAAARARRGLAVSVCLPARECAQSVGAIVETLQALREQGAIDQIVVVDAGSADGTAEVAERSGAVVYQEAELMPELGDVLGKGDAMWRALPRLSGELVCFLDADTSGFQEHYATGLLGPLLCEANEDIAFVKAFYRRPFTGEAPTAQGGRGVGHSGDLDKRGGLEKRGDPENGYVEGAGDLKGGGDAAGGGDGGRVNQLLARPALELFYPELAGVRQPLAGEVAARRELLEQLPFATGYGVELGMLIDVWRTVGLQGMAQVDLDEHRHRHQPLAALRSMALTVLVTISRRLVQEGRLAEVDLVDSLVERPALDEASALR
jgi:glucosyl-3-phosphoglycerate synthase